MESKTENYPKSSVMWAEANAKNKGMRDKRVSLEQAAQIIQDDSHIALGGVQYNRVPVAMMRELIRLGRKGLTVSRGLSSFRSGFPACFRGGPENRHELAERRSDLWSFPDRPALPRGGQGPIRRMEQPGHGAALHGRRDGDPLHSGQGDAWFGYGQTGEPQDL